MCKKSSTVSVGIFIFLLGEIFMEILYVDNQIVVCIKPAGTLCEDAQSDSLPRMLSGELLRRGEANADIFPVHRLDRDTTGVVVFARTKESAAALSRQITEGDFCKTYFAVVHGVPQESRGRLCDLLYFDRKRGKSFVVRRQRAGVKRAELEYSVLDCKDGLSLLKIRLLTGRTHQIRVQFASRQHPLFGDRRYGAPKISEAGLALVAISLRFAHPKTGKALCFNCPVPQEVPWIYFGETLQKPLDKETIT